MRPKSTKVEMHGELGQRLIQLETGKETV